MTTAPTSAAGTASEIRACYYRVRGRSELDLHHIGPDSRPYKLETVLVADKREARRIAAERGATPWNF